MPLAEPGIGVHRAVSGTKNIETGNRALERRRRAGKEPAHRAACHSARGAKAKWKVESRFRFSWLFEHDLFRKPVSTFRDHAFNAIHEKRSSARIGDDIDHGRRAGFD